MSSQAELDWPSMNCTEQEALNNELSVRQLVRLLHGWSRSSFWQGIFIVFSNSHILVDALFNPTRFSSLSLMCYFFRSSFTIWTLHTIISLICLSTPFTQFFLSFFSSSISLFTWFFFSLFLSHTLFWRFVIIFSIMTSLLADSFALERNVALPTNCNSNHVLAARNSPRTRGV